MGYILPIQHYQYQQYHRRTATTDENAFHIERPFKVMLEQQHQQLSKQYERFYPAGYNRYLITPVKASENIFASLTGKGRRINRTI
ncbi:hypothetical protein [Virgibacillus salexigens]|uniref:Uncharacterized protein n=1 Tax=Virgibacillus kapii TaxID=1638645 RepID=A0ABQ2DT82_9BACI|nr:hypothetical protein [Virgibacillus kapii]GGJ68977.1 hypothetical protein GCM10007111_33320 [Virgibacillus kapii]